MERRKRDYLNSSRSFLHDEVLSKRSMTTPEWRCNFRAIDPAFLPHKTDMSD